MTLTADDARKLTRHNVAHFIEYVDGRIEAACLLGKSSIVDPHVIGDHVLTSDDVVAVRLHYEQAGFKWMEHVSPDPGHYADRPYTTLSW